VNHVIYMIMTKTRTIRQLFYHVNVLCQKLNTLLDNIVLLSR